MDVYLAVEAEGKHAGASFTYFTAIGRRERLFSWEEPCHNMIVKGKRCASLNNIETCNRKDSKKMVESMFYDLGEIQQLTGWSRSTVLRRVKAGHFPQPINLKLYGAGTRKALQRLRSDVANWLAA
ncbi:hypothetical protein B5F39_13580 [Cloacibacillus sp. An23]|nr:hypothetical protein B5F39_13580 [Cloacibacillus sp. An23]